MGIVYRAKYFIKLIWQFSIIFGFYFIGNAISSRLSLIIPGSIIGMILLLVSLKLSIVKLNWIKELSTLMLDNMMVFFIPSAVSVLVSYQLFSDKLFEIMTVLILSSVLTFIASALVTELSISNSEFKTPKTKD